MVDHKKQEELVNVKPTVVLSMTFATTLVGGWILSSRSEGSAQNDGAAVFAQEEVDSEVILIEAAERHDSAPVMRIATAPDGSATYAVHMIPVADGSENRLISVAAASVTEEGLPSLKLSADYDVSLDYLSPGTPVTMTAGKGWLLEARPISTTWMSVQQPDQLQITLRQD